MKGKIGGGTIAAVAPGSLAEELGILPGDAILAVNGKPVVDIIDFSFAFADEEIDLTVRHTDGEEEIISFDKDADEELGAEFSSAVFDGIRACANACYFCFVRQLPPGLRESLAVKDDDYRLSFLYGNFITLTNMQDDDYRRIAALHLTPLFVSVHTMNGELRAKMLRLPRADDIAADLDKLAAAGAEYHTQIVLCPGLNDGMELDYTLTKLTARPEVLSVAIVPVGLTDFRRDRYPLRQFDSAEAAKVIAQIKPWQDKMRRTTGRTFIYLSDEFYLTADEPIPPVEEYDDFPQLDNGIGLTRNFILEWKEARAAFPAEKFAAPLIVSGVSFATVLSNLLPSVCRERVLPVVNKLFGASVTVSGLLAGLDIKNAVEAALKSDNSQDAPGVVIPASALRPGENIFIDDYSLQDLRAAFPHLKIVAVQNGGDLWRVLTDWENYSLAFKPNYVWERGLAYNSSSNFLQK